MKHGDVLYLCDGQACQSENRSCVTDGLCKHTAKPGHAVNGFCDRPDLAEDRFECVVKLGGEGGYDFVFYLERDDYEGKEAKA
jgi:hypothetical protein